MPAARNMDVSLPGDLAELVERKVASGDFANENEVIIEGLRILEERDSEIEQWLRDEVAPTFDRYQKGGEPTYSLDEVKQHLADHARRSVQDRRS